MYPVEIQALTPRYSPMAIRAAFCYNPARNRMSTCLGGGSTGLMNRNRDTLFTSGLPSSGTSRPSKSPGVRSLGILGSRDRHSIVGCTRSKIRSHPPSPQIGRRWKSQLSAPMTCITAASLRSRGVIRRPCHAISSVVYSRQRGSLDIVSRRLRSLAHGSCN